MDTIEKERKKERERRRGHVESWILSKSAIPHFW